MANAIAATLAVCAMMILFWQVYLNRSLQTEISFWNQRISENQKRPRAEALTHTLGEQTAKLDQAYTLTQSPYVLSDLVMAFGRSRLDRNEHREHQRLCRRRGFARHAARALLELATQQLRAYVVTLRKDREFAALFGTIALTSLERLEGDLGMHFEWPSSSRRPSRERVLQQMLAFFRRNPFAIASSLVAILLWIGNYFIWTQHQELAAGHQTLQRNGEDMRQALTNHGRVTAELASVKEALAFIDQHLVNEGDLRRTWATSTKSKPPAGCTSTR